MTAWHTPTAEEKAIIRKCAQISAGMKGVKLEVGDRWNPPHTENYKGSSARNINIAMLTDDEDFGETDLFETLPWKVFCKGFELAERGRAFVDFYVYNTKRRGDIGDGDLETNVTAYWRFDKLERVEGTMNGDIWRDGQFIVTRD